MTIIPTYQNILIRASAGTGKTYQLSNRYLGLIARGEPVDTILASTFTRKAAGEILNRILLRIAEAACDEKKRLELSVAVGMELSAARCVEMLRSMTENLHRIHVHTLDGYFNHIAICFPYELGLSPGWRIMDDAEKEDFVKEAIRQMLAKNPENALRIMRGLSPGKTERNVQKQVLDLVEDMYEKTLGASEEAWRRVEKIPLPRVFEDARLAEMLNRLRAENLKFREGNAKCADAVERIIAAAEEGAWDDVKDETLIKNALEADKTSSPLTFSRKPLPPEIASPITHLAFHAVGTLLRRVVEQTFATHAMLQEFHAAYEQLKLDAKVVCFADITRRVAQFISEDSYPAISWRMDTGVNHLLLDEFQDTSADQWDILKPLGRNCTSDASDGEKTGRTFFCVGDMKQAIYAWRGGKAAIFNAVSRTLDGVREEPMDTSFRSSPVIIDCVNTIFGKMSGAIQTDSLPAWEKWEDSFHEHRTARTEYSGYWEICSGTETAEKEETAEASAEEGDSAEEDVSGYVSAKLDETLKYTAKKVKDLYEKTGGAISVGILVRRRAAVMRIMTHLRKLGIRASEEAGNPLTDSHSVRLILSLLKLADHPEDRVSWFHVAHSPLAERYPELAWRAPDEENPETEIHARKVFLMAFRERLLAEGYTVVVDELAAVLKPFTPEVETRRLDQLVKLAAKYESRKKLRPTDFVRYVEKTPVADPTAANIKVMTIHRAKGLQFDAVFLPEMNFLLGGRQYPKYVTGYPQNDEMAPPKLVTRYISKPLRTLLSQEFHDVFDQDKFQRVEEGLSLLYVALTRAIRALYIVVPPSETKGGGMKPSLMASMLLMNVLADTQQAPPETVLAHGGNERWWEDFSPAAESHELQVTSYENEVLESSPVFSQNYLPLRKVEAEKPILFSPGRKYGRGLRRRTPSQAEERGTIDLEKTMHFRASSATRGTVLHAWFEKINWLEYSSPADEELYHIARQNGLDEDMIHRSLQEFHNAVKNERVRAVLSWEKYLPQIRRRILQRGLLSPEQIPECASPADETKMYHWKVYCEKELAVRTEKEFLLGTIDRLVLLWGGEEVLWAECFDYKTSKRLPPEILEEKVEKHRLQLQDYREMLHRHYRIPKEQITAHLIFPMMGVVREV